MMFRSTLKNASRIVIKVGTSSITDQMGRLDPSIMEVLVAQVAQLRREGKEVLLVSSGAVGTGMNVLSQTVPPASLYLKQALAAVGQGRLIRIYEKLFSHAGLQVAQILLTPDALEHPRKHKNTFQALRTLLEFGVVPVINENDAVACDGFQFGDNDSLSAMIARVVDADLLVILSDIDGFYEEDPRLNPRAAFLGTVEKVTPLMEANSKSRGSGIASGGMFTKLQAAKLAMDSGIPMVIANHRAENPLVRIVAGENVGTLFVPSCLNVDRVYPQSGDVVGQKVLPEVVEAPVEVLACC